VNEQLDGIPEFLFYQEFQSLYLYMRLSYIQVPGNGKMAIDMQEAAVFYHPQVVQVHPVFAAAVIKHFYKTLEQLDIGFIHDAGQ
jgi:hypothetical protein